MDMVLWLVGGASKFNVSEEMENFERDGADGDGLFSFKLSLLGVPLLGDFLSFFKIFAQSLIFCIALIFEERMKSII